MCDVNQSVSRVSSLLGGLYGSTLVHLVEG